MSKNTATTGAVTTGKGQQQAQALEISALVSEHADAIRLGMSLREERENRNSQAQKLMARVDALEKLRAIIAWMDAQAFAPCLDFRQAQGHRAAVSALRDIDNAIKLRGVASKASEYEHALVQVHGAIALLVQRAPSSVRNAPEMTFALQGYMSMLRGMRSVELPMNHTTDKTKLAAIREQQQARAQKNLDAVNALRAALDAPKVIDAE